MDTLTLEMFQEQLASDEGHEDSLFNALRALRHLAFDADDFIDGDVGEASGWFIWW